MMTYRYAPGCALAIHKPHLAERLLAAVDAELGGVVEHLTCCRHDPGVAPGTIIINTCAGCDRRYRELYDGVSTTSLWEVLAASEAFPFPDYDGAVMTIHDACPTRTEPRVHDAVRTLLGRMNIRVIEPDATRERAVCCGDSLFGEVPDERVVDTMRRRAGTMPAEDVVVYCVSCIKAMQVGGRRPRHLVDLLFGEESDMAEMGLREWHERLERFIEAH